MYVKPKKHLGQHFLTDMSISQAICDALQSTSTQSVIEVGPGTGVLTQFLLQRNDISLWVAEVDNESIAYLKQNYKDLNVDHILGDFLALDLDKIFPEGVNVIGNFPYNISSQLFFKMLDHKELVNECVCMVQREVAQRIAEPPGKKAYGIISVFLQAYYNIEYLFTVNEDVFNPPPKVKSGVIRLTRNDRTELGCDEKLFKRVVKGVFNQRRKTIRNSLKSCFSNLEEGAQHPFFALRPERLSVEDFIELTNFVANNLKNEE